MSIEAITIPKWGMTMTEGLLAEWMVAVGDRIERGQEIMEVESTKTTNAVESPVSGTLRRIVVPEGDTAPVGALVAVVADDSATDEDIDAFIETPFTNDERHVRRINKISTFENTSNQ